MKKIAFKTLGCRLNQYETDALVTQFHNAGYEVVNFGEKSDVTVINTCTVTNQSDQKSRNFISQAAGRSPGGVLVVAGCMVNHRKEELEKQDNITYVIENEYKNNIFELVDSHFKGEILHPSSMPGDVFGFGTVEKSLHTRTSIKVQDGCDNFCTFCIIPKVRGRAVSRPVGDIVENVRRVTANGFREIVITGVNIGRYDYEGNRFEDVLEKILEVDGDFRVRISSIEPDGFSDRFPSLFSHPKMVPHLHLCLQSGSEKVLLQMRRMYTVKSYLDIIEKFSRTYTGFNFTTDIIVGFPGETEEEFKKTRDVAITAGFSHIHTFRYSRRDGTRAARMADQVPEKIKAERSEIIRKISDRNQLRYYFTMLGQKQRVLIEKPDVNGYAKGYGQHYIPVIIPGISAVQNEFVDVRLDKISYEDPVEVIADPLITP